MPRIVVLTFADYTRIDLVDIDDEKRAIADCVSRCLIGGYAELPLVSARTSVVPIAEIRKLAGTAPATVEPTKRPTLPIAGVLHNIRAFERVIGSHPDVTESDRRRATDRLTDFFAHYEIEADFTEVWALPPLPKPEPHPSVPPIGDMKPPKPARVPTLADLEAMDRATDGVTPNAGV